MNIQILVVVFKHSDMYMQLLSAFKHIHRHVTDASFFLLLLSLCSLALAPFVLHSLSCSIADSPSLLSLSPRLFSLVPSFACSLALAHTCSWQCK